MRLESRLVETLERARKLLEQQSAGVADESKRGFDTSAEAKSLMTEVFRDVSETLRDKNNICKFRNTYILRDLFKH